MNLNTLSSLDSNAAWFNKMMFGPEKNNSPWVFIFQQSDGNRLSISNEHRYFETNPIEKVLCDDGPK